MKQCFKRRIAFLLAIVLLFSALGIPTVVSASSTCDSELEFEFELDLELGYEHEYEYDCSYAQLSDELSDRVSQLVSNNWCDYFFGNITFTSGSAIIVVDGIQKQIAQKDVPVITDDDVMLPIQPIIEIIGEKPFIELESLLYEVLSNDGLLDVYATTQSALTTTRRLLPASSFTNYLGFEVYLDEEEQQVTLTRNFQTRRLIVRTFVQMDFAYLGATDVICWFNSMTILQFATVHETKEAYKQLTALANVEWVEPDIYVPWEESTESMTNEERYFDNFQPFNVITGSWGVGRTGNDRFAEYIRSTGRGNARVIVAVVDSGVDVNHLIFRNPNGTSRIFSGRNMITRDNDFRNRGNYWHGTAVAGIIVDNTPRLNNVQIMPIVVIGTGSTATIVADGIRWATDRGIHVMNISATINFGSVNIVESAIRYAIERNVTVVVAAGNGGRSADPTLGIGGVSPARMTNVITVAATMQDNTPRWDSNWGNVVNIAGSWG